MRLPGILFVLISCFFVFSCKKDEIVAPKSPGPIAHQVTFNFNGLANNTKLVPDSKWYTNSSNDNFTVTKFNYYISNIKLRRTDGYVYSEKESYHLIQHVEGKTSFTVSWLPEGTYNYIEFLVGVDSLRNVSGAQSGALDPANLMYWDWEQGYIFFKLEGSFTSQNQPQPDQYAIHIGGFQGKFNCIQKCGLALNEPIVAKTGKHSTVSCNVLLDEIFKTPSTIGFDAYYAAIEDKTFKLISDNYRDMFVIDQVKNH